MKVFIFHHHLNPGGVTRIIYSQLAATKNCELTVITGVTAEPEKIEKAGAKLIVKEDLNYLTDVRYEPVFLHNLLRNYVWFFKEQVPKEAILHVHNLNLGKNPVLTFAFYLLAKEGYNILNHAHDFAEDRPTNFDFLQRVIEKHFEENLQQVMYPNFPNYRFSVLNSFDYNRLQEYGIEQSRISWLPNPVSLPFDPSTVDKEKARQNIVNELGLDSKKLILTYPVRVIRRKNIGEYILLSVLFKDKAEFLVTQPPKNPKEIVDYDKWVAFCNEKQIRLHFEVGNKVNFEELLMSTDCCVTTSYMEGFGMAYLEPWLFDTPVVGRNIEYVTKDFEADGLRFSTLYKKLKTPNSEKDFKDLDINEQMQIIGDALGQPDFTGKILALNPELEQLLETVSTEVIYENKQLIHTKYSLEGYGSNLQNEYQKFS